MQTMDTKAVTVTVTTLVMGIFGAFLRWLQSMRIYEPETGLATPWAGISVTLAVYGLLMLAGMVWLVFFWLKADFPEEAGAALRTITPIPAGVSWILCVAYVVAGISLMFSAGQSDAPLVQRILGAFAVLSGACLPFLHARAGTPAPLAKPAGVCLTFFLCYWMVFSYQENAQNPVLWAYGPEILALAASALAFYYTTGLWFARGKNRLTLVIVQVAVFLDICTMADAHRLALRILFAATSAMLLLLEFLMVKNRRAG